MTATQIMSARKKLLLPTLLVNEILSQNVKISEIIGVESRWVCHLGRSVTQNVMKCALNIQIFFCIWSKPCCDNNSTFNILLKSENVGIGRGK